MWFLKEISLHIRKGGRERGTVGGGEEREKEIRRGGRGRSRKGRDRVKQ